MEFNLSLGGEKKIKEAVMDPGTIYDTIVVGLGPAGLNAALYLRRKGFSVGIIGRQSGGQVADTSVVENYLGYSTIPGIELVEKFEKHVTELGVPVIRYYGVTSVERNEDRTFQVSCEDGNVYKANSLVIATGASSRKLGCPGEKENYGRGVTYCAICDGPLYRGRDVIVAGGGNSAVEAAMDLAKTSSHVTVVHRSQFRADHILLDEMAKVSNISTLLETEIKSINGSNGMESITILDKKSGVESEIKAEGIFVEIGTVPNSGIFKDLVELNESGQIITGPNGETSMPGVFAAGDVTTGRYKQVIIAAAQGAQAALALNDWYKTKDAR